MTTNTETAALEFDAWVAYCGGTDADHLAQLASATGAPTEGTNDDE